MARTYLFADEAGDFEFSKKPNVSSYFILCTVSMDSCKVAEDLLELRRALAWDEHELGDYFHASEDKQVVRDAVFDCICSHDFKVQATIMEKSKAEPQVRITRARFYKIGWYFHFKHGMPKTVTSSPELLVTTASIGTKKERRSFEKAVEGVMRQFMPKGNWVTNFCPAAAEPCVQVADYCAWALRRKWERGDEQSYAYIKDRMTYEYDLWAHGDDHYY